MLKKMCKKTVKNQYQEECYFIQVLCVTHVFGILVIRSVEGKHTKNNK